MADGPQPRRLSRRLHVVGVGWCAVGVLVLVAGCRTPPGYGRPAVSHAVEARFGSSIASCEAILVPESVEFGRPLTEEQAVVLALWNNATFREALVELDLTRADLVQAGLLPNPEFVYYWPVSDKPFKYLCDFPLETIWLRPIRLKATEAENARAAARLAQLALDLIRDTRQAYADLQLAHDRVKVAERAVSLRDEVLELAERRFQAGDASALEVSAARTDAFRTQQERIRVQADVAAAEERVRNLTGLSGMNAALIPDNVLFDPGVAQPVEELVAEGVKSRPDAVAVEHAARAASERLRIARLGWVRYLGLLDATSGRVTGHEFSPALRMTVPIFNRNQGGIARAEAELQQIERRRQTVHDQIVMDVRTAFARFQQARIEMDLLKRKTRPEIESALLRATAAYKGGNVTYLIVLEANRQLIDVYTREAQLHAELRRAWAELERSVGRRLTEGRAP